MTCVSVFGKGAISVLSGACLLAGPAGAKPMVATLFETGVILEITVPDECMIQPGPKPNYVTCNDGSMDAAGMRQIGVTIWGGPVEDMLQHYNLRPAVFAKDTNGFMRAILLEARHGLLDHMQEQFKPFVFSIIMQPDTDSPAGFEACVAFDADVKMVTETGPLRVDYTGLHCAHYDKVAQWVIHGMIEYHLGHKGVVDRVENFEAEAKQVLRSMRVQ